jgi:tetratricopeptide (TPR) repeat protein
MQGASIRRAIVVCSMLLGLMLAALPVAAQTGQVKGKVVDAKDQPVEGAAVLIEATDGMGRKYPTKTNRRGEYIQIGLQPGMYRITVQKDNLSDMAERKIGLDVVEVNLKLAPGGGANVSAEERKKAEARVAAIKGNFEAGVNASNAGNLDEAIAKFNAVLVEVPKCVECYTNIAAVHVRKKEYDQAEGMYKKAIEINPSSTDAYNGLANVYNAQKKFDLAAEASAQAQKLGAAAPGGASASSVFNQGVIAWNASKIADAKKSFQEAIKLDPKLADAHYWLGMANLNEGNMPDAAKAFDEYLKLAPTGQYAEQAKGILTQIKK